MKLSLQKFQIVIGVTVFALIMSLSSLSIEYTLAQGGTANLSGTVTNGVVPDGQEPQALAGVNVNLATAANVLDTILAPYASDAVRRFEAITDENGNYSFENVPPGDYVIFATGTELADLPPITLVLDDGESQVIDFSMTEGGSIIGEVTSANDVPMYGGAITLFNRQLAVQTAYIRSDGSYLFEHVVPGTEYQLFVQTATEATLSQSNLRVEEGEALQLDLVVERASRLTGRIVSDAGAPIEGALVSVESPTLRWSGITDDDGVYDLSGAGIEYRTLIPGEYDVRIRADRHASFFEEALDLSQGGDFSRNFVLERAGTVTGVVLDSNGVPVGNATISAVGETGSEFTALAQDDGTYTLDLLNPDQAYTVVAFATNYIPTTIEEVTAPKGEIVGGVDFVLELGTYVEGTVLQAGSPIVSAIVDMYGADGTVNTALSDSSGVFTYDGLEPGDYVVVISTALQDAGSVGSMTISESLAQVEFEISETGFIFGVAENATAVSVSFEGVVIAVQPTDGDGNYELAGLPPGTYDVIAHGESGVSDPVSAKVEAGGEVELDLALE